MKLIEFKRPDGEPLYCWLEAISVWTAASGKEDAKTKTDIWIGGKMFTLGMPIEEVFTIIEEA